MNDSPSQDGQLAQRKREFDDQGFTIVREFISPAVADSLKRYALQDPAIAEHSQVVLDAEGRKSRLTLWYEPSDDLLGRVSRSERMIREISTFLDGEVSFFHAKVMQKLPQSGGSWEWHQDYGYWYDDGFLSPALASCFVALDVSTEANGCLRVIPGSHAYGRIEHGSVGEQAGADMERVLHIRARHGEVLCEMAPGDAIYFHANLLHSSAANLSDKSRLTLISCFFRRDNESIHSDPRFRHKPFETIAHATILDGPTGTSNRQDFLERNPAGHDEK